MESQDPFLTSVHRIFDQAEDLLNDRTGTGQNSKTPIRQMFPSGYRDTSFLVYMKAARVLGKLEVRNLQSARDELLDIINYAAFTIVMIDEQV